MTRVHRGSDDDDGDSDAKALPAKAAQNAGMHDSHARAPRARARLLCAMQCNVGGQAKADALHQSVTTPRRRRDAAAPPTGPGMRKRHAAEPLIEWQGTPADS